MAGLALANNETSIDYAIRAAITPPTVLKQLARQFDAMGKR